MSDPPKESAELELLERVLLRLALADSDEKLEKTLASFLVPSIIKLDSPHASVKAKVMELLSHVTKRVGPQSAVSLPVDALLAKFAEEQASTLVRNVSLNFLEVGMGRIGGAQRAVFVPRMLASLPFSTDPQRAIILRLVISALVHLKLPQDDINVKRSFLFPSNKADEISAILLPFLLDLLINAGSSDEHLGPGLSKAAKARLVALKPPLTPDEGVQSRIGALRLCGSELFSPDAITSHVVVGLCDPHHAVANEAELTGKRILSTVSGRTDSLNSIKTLYTMFLGNAKATPPPSADHLRSPVGIRVRERILQRLTAARAAVEVFPSSIQTVFECWYGESKSSPKLRVLGTQLAMAICDYGTLPKAVVPVILEGLLKLIKEHADSEMRKLVYVAVGLLARREPQSVNASIEVIRTFFDQLKTEEASCIPSVREGLILVAQAYRLSSFAVSEQVYHLLHTEIQEGEHPSRLAAVLCANLAFHFIHVPARYLCILAAGDAKEDVRDEAMRGLQGPFNDPARGFAPELTSPLFNAAGDRALWPSFTVMANHVLERAEMRMRSGQQVYRSGQSFLPFSPWSYHAALTFISKCMRAAAGQADLASKQNGSSPVTQNTASANVELFNDAGDDEDVEDAEAPVDEHVRVFLQSSSSLQGVEAFRALCEEAMGSAADAPLRHLASSYLLLLTRTCSDTIGPSLAIRLPWLKAHVFSGMREMRAYVSSLFGIVCRYLDATTLQILLNELSEAAAGDAKSAQRQASVLMAIGHTIAGMLLQPSFQDVRTHLDTDIKRSVAVVASAVRHLDSTVSSAACEAIGVIGSACPLPLPDGDLIDYEKMGSDKGKPLGPEMTKSDVVRTLIERLRAGAAATAAASATSTSTSSSKQGPAERAALSLGRIHRGEPKCIHRAAVMLALFDTQNVKNVEMHFSIGQALAMLGNLDEMIVEISDRFILRGSVNGRRAGCIWLLCIVRYGSALTMNSLRQCQTAFTAMLGDTDELIQEVSGKGLSLVHSRGDQDAKQLLVNGLVDTLMTGKRQKTTELSGDTKVFEDNMLGKSPEGAGMSTYRELCGLATDMGQPDLIYKFLNLASHHAAWRTRRGAAFGFAEIAAGSSDLLEKHLPRMIPRLFRLQYDPNDKVRSSMAGIWHALVKDPRKTVDKYINEIVQELLESLGNSLWRSREGACLALTELIAGRPYADFSDKFVLLWQATSRALDDIKESVRKAAAICAKKLAAFAVRVCDPSLSPRDAPQAVNSIVPYLLGLYGLGSNVKEVLAISLDTILEIIAHAGVLLRPHASAIVQVMIEGMSNLEPQALNYLSLHHSRGEDAGQRLEQARAMLAQHSPLLEAAEKCVPVADTDGVRAMAETLLELAKHGVGLQTRCGTGRLIATLAQQRFRDIGEMWSAKLMKITIKRLTDNAGPVRDAFSYAASHLSQACTDETVDTLISFVQSLCLGNLNLVENSSTEHSESSAGTEEFWLIAARVCSDLARHASGVFSRHANEILPLAFVGSTRLGMEPIGLDFAAQRADAVFVWRNLWEDQTSSLASGLRLYGREILNLVLPMLRSNSWDQRKRAALSIKRIAEGIRENIASFSVELGDALLGGLEGRTWDGKSALLEAFSALCGTAEAVIDDRKSFKLVMKECSKKKDKVYRREAFKALAALLKKTALGEEEDIFEQVHSLVWPVVNGTEEDEDDNDDEDARKKPLTLALQATAWTILAEAWPRGNKALQNKYQTQLLIGMAAIVPKSVWNVRQAILEVAVKVVQTISNETALSEAVFSYTCQLVQECATDSKYPQTRSLALSVITTLCNSIDDHHIVSFWSEPTLKRVRLSVQSLLTDPDESIRQRARDLEARLDAKMVE